MATVITTITKVMFFLRKTVLTLPQVIITVAARWHLSFTRNYVLFLVAEFSTYTVLLSYEDGLTKNVSKNLTKRTKNDPSDVGQKSVGY